MADFSATADALKIFLSGIAGILGVVVGRRSVNVKADPPLEVKGATKYVTCEQCELRHKDVENRLEQGDAAFRELRHEIHDGFQRVTDRISPVAEACAANSAALQVLLKHQPDKLP